MFKRGSGRDDLLKDVPLFSELSGKHRKLIAQHFDEVEMPAGAVLAEQGKLGLEFIFILEGNVRVEQDGQPVAQLGQGDYFGEISLLDGGPRTATIVAESEMKLLVLHVQYFTALLDKSPEIARHMLRPLCEYVRRKTQRAL